MSPQLDNWTCVCVYVSVHAFYNWGFLDSSTPDLLLSSVHKIEKPKMQSSKETVYATQEYIYTSIYCIYVYIK